MFGYENVNNLYIVKLKNNRYICARYHKKNDLGYPNDELRDINGQSRYKVNAEDVITYYSITNAINLDEIKYGCYISKNYIWKLLSELNNFRKINYKKDDDDKKVPDKKPIDNKTKYKELTTYDYSTEPAICRKKEVDKIITILASEKKNPLLIGESGVGKTTIVDELAYLIQIGEVPDFLSKKKIIEISQDDIVAGSQYVGVFEKKIKKLLNYAKENDSIVFIDETHTVFGAGASSKNDNDLASELKHYIERENLRLIGTTTKDEYDKYFSNSALKRRFQTINVDEPNDKDLKIITYKIFNDYSNKNGISLKKIEKNMSEVIEILIDFTNSKHRSQFDMMYNPDLIVTIIDTAFASAKINNRESLTVDDIIYAVDSMDRLSIPSKESCLSNLNTYKKESKKLVRSNIISFSKN